jgi:hypothetical protein
MFVFNPITLPFTPFSENMVGHWVWDHFYTDGSLYRNNNSNKNAWCIHCLAYHRELIQNSDTVAVATTGLAQSRTPAEVDTQGTFHSIKFKNLLNLFSTYKLPTDGR